MATIKISRGPGSADIAAGVYEVTLAAVEGPKTIYPANAPEGTDVLDWRFVLDDGSEVSGTTSTSSGPRSKMYAWLTALNSGRAPEIDDEIDTDSLVGQARHRDDRDQPDRLAAHRQPRRDPGPGPAEALRADDGCACCPDN